MDTPIESAYDRILEKENIIAKADEEIISVLTGDIIDKEKAFRLVLSPDGKLLVDLSEKLPAKFCWIEADGAKIKQAIESGAIRAAFELESDEDVNGLNADEICRQAADMLEGKILNWLSLARRGGGLVTGFMKVEAGIKSAKAGLLLQASDGADGGKAKLSRLAKHNGVDELCLLSKEKLAEPFGATSEAVHLLLFDENIAQRVKNEVTRLNGVRFS